MEQPAWLERRLQELRHEFKQGEAQLAELDRQRAQLRDTLLRISGAIQVLEEVSGTCEYKNIPHCYDKVTR